VKRGASSGRAEPVFVHKSAPLDELDELPASRPLPLVRHCGKRECRRHARAGGRYCRPCATEAVRRWRDRHAAQLAARERARSWSDEQRLLRRARAYVDVYLRRGKLARGRCEVCGEPQTLAAWDDLAEPLAVRWLCAEHYADRRDARHEADEARVALAAEWAEVRRQVLLLPPPVQAQLNAAALQGPAGHGAQPGSTFYWWTLRRELARLQAKVSSEGFWT